MTCWPWQETRKQQLGPQSSNNKNCSFMLVSFSADSNSGGRRTQDAGRRQSNKSLLLGVAFLAFFFVCGEKSIVL